MYKGLCPFIRTREGTRQGHIEDKNVPRLLVSE